jgi:serine phosphatase RsbU (regulator of sigma subunit)/transcriptional regulator with GAF, ATPase, and Fis domain
MDNILLAVLILFLGAGFTIMGLRIRSRRSLESRVHELAQLAEAGRVVLTTPLDVQRLAEKVYEEAGRIVDTRLFQLGLFEGNDYAVIFWTRDGERLPPSRFTLTPGQEGIVGWLRRTRQPLLVGDFAKDMDRLPARPRYVDDDPPRSAIFVPLMTRDDVIGAISIQSRTPNAFTESHLRIVGILANYVAAAMANARMLEEALRRARYQALLGDVSRQIRGLQALPDLYRQVVHQVAGTFEFEVVRIYEWQSALGWHRGAIESSADQSDERETAWRTEHLVLQAETAHTGETPRELAIGAGLSGLAAARRQPVLIQQETDRGGWLAPGSVAALAVPMIIEDRVVGTLEMHTADAQMLDPDFQAAAELLAGHLAIAILENQTYQIEQRRAEQLEAMGDVTRAVSSILDPEKLLDEIVRLTSARLGIERVQIFLRQGSQISLRAGGAPEHVRQYALDGPGLIAFVARTGEPVLIPDVRDDPRYIAAIGWDDTRTEMAVPLVFGEHILGVFDFQSLQRGAYSPDDLQLAQAFAAMVAIALRNAQLFTREREAAWLSASLLRVAETAAAPTSPDETLTALVQLLPTMVDRPWALVWRATEEPGWFYPESAVGLGPAQVRAFQRTRPSLSAFNPPAPGWTSAERSLGEWVSRPAPALEFVQGQDTVHVYALKYGGRLLGLLSLPQPGETGLEPSVSHRTHEDDLLLGIVHQLAAALESKRIAAELEVGRRLERELELAREIQTSFLPRSLPQPEGWQLSAFWKSAREVGGDFYDLFPLPAPTLSDPRQASSGPRWGVVIADVADKGVPAALYMALCRTLMRAVAISRIDPAETLTRVNALLFSDSQAELFVTLVYAVWEPASGRLLYGNAGHNPPLFLPTEGEPRWLTDHGVALGVIEDATYATRELQVEPGSTLALYTDGVIDAHNPTLEEFGVPRFMRTVTDASPAGAEAVTRAVEAALEEHVGAREPFDDVTLLVLHHAGLRADGG